MYCVCCLLFVVFGYLVCLLFAVSLLCLTSSCMFGVCWVVFMFAVVAVCFGFGMLFVLECLIS